MWEFFQYVGFLACGLVVVGAITSVVMFVLSVMDQGDEIAVLRGRLGRMEDEVGELRIAVSKAAAKAP